jgi:hypothetical protein
VLPLAGGSVDAALAMHLLYQRQQVLVTEHRTSYSFTALEQRAAQSSERHSARRAMLLDPGRCGLGADG